MLTKPSRLMKLLVYNGIEGYGEGGYDRKMKRHIKINDLRSYDGCMSRDEVEKRHTRLKIMTFIMKPIKKRQFFYIFFIFLIDDTSSLFYFTVCVCFFSYQDKDYKHISLILKWVLFHMFFLYKFYESLSSYAIQLLFSSYFQ